MIAKLLITMFLNKINKSKLMKYLLIMLKLIEIELIIIMLICNWIYNLTTMLKFKVIKEQIEMLIFLQINK